MSKNNEIKAQLALGTFDTSNIEINDLLNITDPEILAAIAYVCMNVCEGSAPIITAAGTEHEIDLLKQITACNNCSKPLRKEIISWLNSVLLPVHPIEKVIIMTEEEFATQKALGLIPDTAKYYWCKRYGKKTVQKLIWGYDYYGFRKIYYTCTECEV